MLALGRGIFCSTPLLLLLVLLTSNAGPVRSTVDDINDGVLAYLRRFGYLAESTAASLVTEVEVRRAIGLLQTFGRIPVTGRVDGATVQLMSNRRCGVPDVNTGALRSKRFVLQGTKWQHFNLTWSLRLGTNQMSKNEMRRQIFRALDMWSQASQLTFTEINDDKADILIFFKTGDHGDNYPFDGKGNTLAHAFFPGRGIGGDVHFDDDEPWVPFNDDYQEGVSFYTAALHELGHSLGLSHSSEAGSIMLPYYFAIGADFSLSADDRAGIQSLYGSRDEITMPALRPEASTTKRTRVTRVTTASPTTSTKRTRVVFATTTTKSTRTTTRRSQTTTKSYRQPRTTTEAPENEDEDEYVDEERPPNTCDTAYDAVTVIHNTVFIFKDRFFWRISSRGLMEKRPIAIDRFINGLPSDLKRIDAIYQKKTHYGSILIFSGKWYWNCSSETFDAKGPFPLKRLGLPSELDQLDAAFVWGHNGKTYFFRNASYWRFDEKTGRVEVDYPRDIAVWKGMPQQIDAVFQHVDGNTYLFKRKVFWKFNDRQMKLAHSVPSLSATYWMGCATRAKFQTLPSSASRNTCPWPVFLLALIFSSQLTSIKRHFWCMKLVA